MSDLIEILAPAKINLFLHIIGQRNDGYHLLQSVFQYIDLHDTVKLQSRDDGFITRINPIPTVPPDQDLVVKAARLLQKFTGTKLGVEINLEKRIPMGAGLGGGSSDAASTLMGLNELWGLHLSTTKLIELGLSIGADVPFFIFGKNAFVEGIGEKLTEVKLQDRAYFLIYPGVSISTKTIFTAPNLTRNRTQITIDDFDAQYVKHGLLLNDLQNIAIQNYPEVMQAMNWLKFEFPDSKPMMTGSGSSVFCEISKNTDVSHCLSKLPTHWQGFKVNSLMMHPAYNLKSSLNVQKGSRQVG
jgi:4-diphosphocytidyl-2-C-methyl-D-erythritol kinase